MPLMPKLPAELVERYTILRELDRGGMGVVYLADDRELGRQVVVKCMLAPEDAKARRRAVREGRVLARLRHENVLRVFAAGDSEEGPYLVMEYMPGGSLASPPPGCDLLGLFTQVAAGLDTIHEHGLVHRDMKPGNILLDGGGRAVIADFGVVQDPDRTSLTATGHVVGTMVYLAPEVLGGDPATPASDWYGWGVSLYVCVTGAAPFAGSELIAHVASGAPLNLDLSAVPEGRLRFAIEGTLDPDPDRRRAPSVLLAELDGGPRRVKIQSVSPRPSEVPLGRSGAPLTPSKAPPGAREVSSDGRPETLAKGSTAWTWSTGLGLGVAGLVLGSTLALWNRPVAIPVVAPIIEPALPAAVPKDAPPLVILEEVLTELQSRFVGIDWSSKRALDDAFLEACYPVFVSLRFEPLLARYLRGLRAWVRSLRGADLDVLGTPKGRSLTAIGRGLATVCWAFDQALKASAPGTATMMLFGAEGIEGARSLPPSWDRQALKERVAGVRRIFAAQICELDAARAETHAEVALLITELGSNAGLVGPDSAYAMAGCQARSSTQIARMLPVLRDALPTVSRARRLSWMRAMLNPLGRTSNNEVLAPPLRDSVLDAVEEILEDYPGKRSERFADVASYLYQRMRTLYLVAADQRVPDDGALARGEALFIRLAGTAPVEARSHRKTLRRLKRWFPHIKVKELDPLYARLQEAEED